jgi:hypothetical protein
MILPLLAQVATADVSAQSLKDWLAILFYLVAGAASIVGLWRMLSGNNGATEISGQPLEVKAHAALATKDEVTQMHGRLTRERIEIDREIKRVEEAAERRTLRIEGKLDDNTALTAEVKGEMKGLTSAIDNLTSSVANFLSREK